MKAKKNGQATFPGGSVVDLIFSTSTLDRMVEGRKSVRNHFRGAWWADLTYTFFSPSD